MVYKILMAARSEWLILAIGPLLALPFVKMLRRFARLFIIKTRLEAWAIIYALALGSTMRGMHYLHDYPGFGGYLLFFASTGAVFMAGAKILDAVPPKWNGKERRQTCRADRRQA